MFRTIPASIVGASLLAAVTIGGPSLAQDKLTIATSLPSLGFPFFVHMQKELRAEAESLGNIDLIESDGQNRTPKQTADVEAAIIQGVDGIIISPLDSVAMAPALQQAVDAGIPVVTIDRSVRGVPGLLAHVGADNVKGGEAQGRLIAKMYPNGATIVNLQGQPGASPAIDRNAGVHNALDPMADKYKFIAEQTANFAREEGPRSPRRSWRGWTARPTSSSPPTTTWRWARSRSCRSRTWTSTSSASTPCRRRWPPCARAS